MDGQKKKNGETFVYFSQKKISEAVLNLQFRELRYPMCIICI